MRVGDMGGRDAGVIGRIGIAIAWPPFDLGDVVEIALVIRRRQINCDVDLRALAREQDDIRIDAFKGRGRIGVAEPWRRRGERHCSTGRRGRQPIFDRQRASIDERAGVGEENAIVALITQSAHDAVLGVGDLGQCQIERA